MFSFSGTAASGQKLPLWSTFLLPVNENWVVSLCKSCAKKKKEKKSAHSIILGNFWPDHEKLKMKFLLP